MPAGEKIKLKTLLQDRPWNGPLKEGTLTSDLFAFEFDGTKEASDQFKPFVRDLAYDCGELAICTFLQARAYGKNDLALLPFVVSGSFHHKSVSYNTDSGDLNPTNLAGRRFGVRTYSQTTGVWARGILQNEYGTDLSKVTWVTFDDAHIAEHTDPPNCERAPAGKKLIDMLLGGELDGGLLGSNMPKDPRLKTVIPNADEAAKEWGAKYGVTPINHMFVVKRSLCESHPEVVKSIFDTLAKARSAEPSPFPIGLDGNWKALELVSQYAYQQSVIPKQFSVEELFSDVAPILGR